MKVKILKTGEIAEYSNSYGMRLIEQGKAILAGEQKKPKSEEAETGKVENAAPPVRPKPKRKAE